MLSKFNPIEIEDALEQTALSPPFPPSIDRTSWRSARERVGADRVAEILDQAAAYASAPIPQLSASLFLEYSRTGQREGYQNPMRQRRLMLTTLTIAECLECEGRFLDPVLDVAWAICEESTWAISAHQPDLTDIHRPVIDLGAAMTALELAETDLLLGDVLDPMLSKRIGAEVDRRLLTPFLTRHDHMWLHGTKRLRVNNWTAVCNCGVVGAALYLEKDLSRLAEIIARALRSLDDYLATFDSDGGSSEGPGYWDFGFGHYTKLAHLIEWRTGGRIDLFAGALIERIASYPLRTSLGPGVYVNFSDNDASVGYSPTHLAFLSRRLGLPGLGSLAAQLPADDHAESPQWRLRELFWIMPADAVQKVVAARHDWFAGMMWMIARFDPQDPNGLVLAAKGGHNGEMHNHNDVGAFIAHLCGESIIPDLGRGRYTKAYFDRRRYEHLATGSRGHSVPVSNGYAQVQGIERAATLIAHGSSDTENFLELELKSLYPAAARVDSLRRRLVLHRETPRGWVEVKDTVAFVGGPGTLESVLVVFGDVELGEGDLAIHGLECSLRVRYDATTVQVAVELYPDVDLNTGPRDVRRILFALRKPSRRGSIRLELVPE